MNNKIVYLFLLFSFTFQLNLNAQSNVIDGVKHFNSNYFQAIKDAQNEVVGYYVFYKSDKAGKGKALFELNVYDPEFNLAINKKMEKSSKTALLSASSNGTSIAFRFLNYKTWEVEFIAYNFKGEEIQRSKREVENKFEKSTFSQGTQLAGLGLMPIEGYGYAEYGYANEGKFNYRIDFHSETKDGKSWKKTGNKEKIEGAQGICSVGENLISTVVSRKGMYSMKDTEMYIVSHNVKTGKRNFKLNLKKAKLNSVIVGGQFDEENNIVLYGLDYELDQKITKASRGLVKVVLSQEGEILSKSKLNWKKDFRFKSDDDKEYGNIHIHDFHLGSNGNTYIVGEQFSLNGGATLLGLASGSNITTFKIDDLVMIELDPNFKVVSVESIEKFRNNFSIEGIPLASITMLGSLASMLGYFDFMYIQPNKDTGGFSVGYVDSERKLLSKNKFYFGSAAYKDGEYKLEKIDLTKKNTTFFIKEAKPGYIAILEHNRKEDTLAFKIEKMQN